MVGDRAACSRRRLGGRDDLALDEVGTRIPVTRCLTREEELRERHRASTLLGLVGAGHFRDGG